MEATPHFTPQTLAAHPHPEAGPADALGVCIEACFASSQACVSCADACARHGETLEHCRVCADACRACERARHAFTLHGQQVA